VLIFNIYKLDESEEEFNLVQDLTKISLSILDMDERFIDAIKNSNFKFYRLMACLLAIDLKSPKSLSLEYKEKIIKALEGGLKCEKLNSLLKNEINGLLNQTRIVISRSGESLHKKSPLFFTLRPNISGFFSIIENIFNAYIISTLAGRKLIVSLEGGKWWPYDCDITKLIQLDNLTFINFHPLISSTLRFKKQGRYRKMYDSLPANTIATYNYLKSQLYLKFYSSASNWLGTQINVSPYSHSFYIRLGDKAELEDLKWDVKYIVDNISNLRSTKKILILSDDIPFLKQMTNYNPNIVFDDDDYNGFWFGNECKSDASEIIRKYLTMCLTENLIGDTGSNLVNASAWTRIALNKPPLDYNQFYNTPPFSLI